MESLKSYGMRFMTALLAPRLDVDVPNERWLQENVAYAKEKGTNRFGVPFMGKITGCWQGAPPTVAVSVLAALPGQRNEQRRVRQDSIDWLTVELSANGLQNTGIP